MGWEASGGAECLVAYSGGLAPALVNAKFQDDLTRFGHLDWTRVGERVARAGRTSESAPGDD